MRTEEIKIYKFSELSEEAQRKALDNFEPFIDFMFQEAFETFKKFSDVFDIYYRNIDFLEKHRSTYDVSANIDDDVLSLRGWRLATYIWNNYRTQLFSGKYYGKLVYDVPVSKEHPIGARHVKRYSNIFLSSDCVLTGVCYDYMLTPIYDFLNNPNDTDDLGDLLESCIDLLCSDVSSEYDARLSDECKTEDIEANEYEFYSNGEQY